MLLTSICHYLSSFTIGFCAGMVLGIVGSSVRWLADCAEVSAEIRGS